MQHARDLIIKFVYIAAILAGVLGIFGGFSAINILITATIVTGFTYVIGNLWVLPALGYGVATIINAILGGIIIWATELILVGFGLSATIILIAAGLIAVGEYLFHLVSRVRQPAHG